MIRLLANQHGHKARATPFLLPEQLQLSRFVSSSSSAGAAAAASSASRGWLRFLPWRLRLDGTLLIGPHLRAARVAGAPVLQRPTRIQIGCLLSRWFLVGEEVMLINGATADGCREREALLKELGKSNLLFFWYLLVSVAHLRPMIYARASTMRPVKRSWSGPVFIVRLPVVHLCSSCHKEKPCSCGSPIEL